MVKVNGTMTDAAGLSIAEYLKQSSFDTTRIAIECNEEFIPKAQYEETILKDGDTLEVVSFVGGG